MEFKKDKEVLQNFAHAMQYEWLETNGLGGWASSSILFANTRRYHGLLVAAINHPANRMVIVSKLDESIIVEDKRFELGCNLYPGNTIHPQGHQYLQLFQKKLFPQWVYEMGAVQLKKTVVTLHGENSTLVIYDILDAPGSFTMELQPFLSVRDYHSLMHANNAIQRNANFQNGLFTGRPYDGTPDIFIKVPRGDFHHNPNWYFQVNYPLEEKRGLEFEEDLFTYGHFSISLEKGDSMGIIISTENPADKDVYDLLAKENLRRQILLSDQPEDNEWRQLILAADQFIVKRDAVSFHSTESGRDALKTIIAGYHWFTDWGRDTMISLPGLCLSTGRFEDAKKILAAFGQAVSMGMLPTRFHENEPPEYNNVDGTLWYFIAAYKYLLATGDKAFMLKKILPVMEDIIAWHFKGTRYNIHVDVDGLLIAGEKGQQLTWMDAKVGDWVVTPRMGKPVEVQALWYNALCIYAELLKLNKKKVKSNNFARKSNSLKASFNRQFWYSKGKYLYDVIDEYGKPDAALRPNQLFAISLPFALLDDEKKARNILKIVTKKLYTPVGLRSLSLDDPLYIGVYDGDVFQRDAAYHQGTVWSWLLGAYVDSIMKCCLPKSRETSARKAINNFEYHLNDAGIGSASEIFDGDAPHYPRGCIAQAWGVAELLRVMKEYKLFEGRIRKSFSGKKKKKEDQKFKPGISK